MRNDLVDLTLVVDRSGSMDAIRDDAEGGVNAFIRDQANESGQALLTLVQFDTVYEFIYQAVPIKDATPFRLEPRGSTALLDAVGRAIIETGQRLAAIPEADRPGLVVFVVMTDGQENASREFTREQIKKMIEHQQTQYNWKFTFLGADQDAFAEAESMGITGDGAANFSKQKVASAMSASNKKVARMRHQLRESLPIDNAFTVAEREEMN